MATLPTTNGMQISDYSAAPSLPDFSLELGNQVDEFYGKSVANFGALPTSGNFLGQQIWVVDLRAFAVWTGAGLWIVDTPRRGAATLSVTTGAMVPADVTFSPAFPAGVVPRVALGINHPFTDSLTATYTNATNTGMTIRLYSRLIDAPNVPVTYIAVRP